MLPGIRTTVHADDPGVLSEGNAAKKLLEEGGTYYAGEIIQIGTDNVWVVLDIRSGTDNKYQVKGNSEHEVTQPKYIPSSSGNGIWVVEDLFKVAESEYLRDVYCYVDMTDKEIKGVGLKCYHGHGTEDDPFLFTLAYEQPAETFIVEVGEGHEELAKSMFDFCKARGWAYSLSGTTITLYTGEYHYGMEYSEAIRKTNQIVSSFIKNQQLTDNGEYWISCALNTIGNYSTYDEIFNEKTDIGDKRIGDDGLKLYLLWADKAIDKAGLTVKDPVAGTAVSANKDGQDKYDPDTQNPRPSAGADDTAYHIYQKESGPAVYWKKGDELFVGTIEDGVTYTASGKIEAAVGYYFDQGVSLSFNGNDPASFSYDSFRQLSISGDLVSKTDGFYPSKGDGGSWKKGSAETLDFTFKRTVDDGTTYDSFIGIRIGDEEIERIDENYTAAPESSVVIRLQPALLEKLTAGEYILTALFVNDMSASAKFTITDKSSSNSSSTPYQIPKTGIE